MLPVSTRTLSTRQEGLPEGIRRLATWSPDGFLIEGSSAPFSTKELEAVVRKSAVPVLGLVVDSLGPRADRVPSVDAPGNAGGEALDRVFRSLALLFRLKGDALLISPSRGGLLDDRLPIREALGESPQPAPARGLIVTPQEDVGLISSQPDAGALQQWRAERRPGREHAVERICRAVHRLLGASGGARITLLVGSDALSLDDLEALGWMLGEFPDQRLGVALDLGALGLRGLYGDPPPGRWVDTLGDRLHLLLLSDHDQERADLLLGTGLLELESLRKDLPRSVKTVIRLDPTLPEGVLQSAVDQVPDLLRA